jgi:NADP+-dependent farnesol dehydrogenase
MEKWRGKIAVVTGASSGIGEAIVRDLAANGMVVIGLARRVEMIPKIDDKVTAIKCDVADQESIKAAFGEIEKKFGKVHVLVNNAGVANYVSVLGEGEEITQKLNDVIDINLKGLIQCTRLAVKLMRKSEEHGMVINVSSIMDSIIPYPNFSGVYPATKHAVKAFTEIVRQELVVLGCEKVKVCNISPGVVKTNIGHAGGRPNATGFYEERSHLVSEDISQGVIYVMSTPHNVNVTQVTIKPVGEKF